MSTQSAVWLKKAQNVTSRKAHHAGIDWTTDELRFLEQELAKATPVTFIALQLGRTYAAVTAKAYLLRGTLEERTLKLGELCTSCWTTASLSGTCFCNG